MHWDDASGLRDLRAPIPTLTAPLAKAPNRLFVRSSPTHKGIFLFEFLRISILPVLTVFVTFRQRLHQSSIRSSPTHEDIFLFAFLRIAFFLHSMYLF